MQNETSLTAAINLLKATWIQKKKPKRATKTRKVHTKVCVCVCVCFSCVYVCVLRRSLIPRESPWWN